MVYHHIGRNRMYAPRNLRRSPYTKACRQRRAYHKRIQAANEGGNIALVMSGMDCDGVSYSGKVRIVPANWRDVDAAIADEESWADGPKYYDIMKPSEAEVIEYHSLALTLEAFEDGHLFTLYR